MPRRPRTATTGGAAGQSPTLTVGKVALSSISLNATTVVGGNSLTGTAVLTAPAPVGGAAVALSAGDPLSVPASVTVPSGATTAVFTVSTRLVGGTISGTVLGLLILRYLNVIRDFLLYAFHIQVFSSSVYGLPEIPAVINPTQIVIIDVSAVAICVLAALIPAVSAATLAPANTHQCSSM